jgi:hypothetical protein
MLNLLDPERASRAFESVTRAAEGELDDSLRSTFRMGDRLQRSMVDATFRLIGVGGFDPAAWSDALEETLDRATDVVRRAAETVSGDRPEEGGSH